MKNKGALYIFFGNFITKFVAFFGSVFVISVLSKSAYGTLGYIENLFNYAYLLAGLGLSIALLRYVVLAETAEEKKQYYRYIIKTSTAFNGILLVFACIVAYVYPHKESFSEARWLLPLMMLSLPFHSLVDSSTSMYRAMFDNKRYAIVSCLSVSTLIAAKYLLARFFGLPGAVLSSVIVYGSFAIVLLFVVRRRFFSGIGQVEPLHREQKNTVIRYSLQYMVTNGIWALFMLNDVFLLGNLTGDSLAVASYKVAYVLPGNLSFISGSIGILVAPYFVRNENNIPWVRSAYKKTYIATAGIMLAVSLGLYIFAEPVFRLIFPEYLDAVPVMRVLLIASFINNGLRYTNAHLLSSMGQVKYNMAVSFGGVVLQVLCNYFVIPRYGAMGIAYTSVLVYSLMTIALLIIFYKKYFQNKTE